MQEIVDSLGLPSMTVILTVIALITVGIIQSIRMVLTKYVKAKWTQKIPGWVWLVLSVAIPIGIAYVFQLDWIETIINSALPPTMSGVDLPQYSPVASGVIAGMGSKGAYSLIKKAGLAGDYKPGGTNDASGPLPGQEPQQVCADAGIPIQPTLPIVEESLDEEPKVTIFLKIHQPSKPGYYALVERGGKQTVVPITAEDDRA